MAKRKRVKSTKNTVWSVVESYLVDAKEIAEDSEYADPRFSLPPTDDIKSWDELIKVFREELYLTPGNEAVIALSLAVTLSPYLPGEPIWLFIIGPPSSGKTTIIEAFGDNNMYCDTQSQLHSKMLVSGWKSADGKDASYLPKMNKRTLFIKDYTTVVSMDSRSQEELYGILRDVFDGKFKKQYGNHETREFSKIKFGLVAGVTKVIHGDARSSLGERFLKVEYIEKDEFDEMSHIRAAMRGYHRKEERTERLERTVLGYLDNLVTNMPPIEEMPSVQPESEFEDKILNLGQLVSYLRAQVDRRGDDSLLYRPDKEIASRVSVQLTKIAEALMLVLNKTEPDDELYRILRKLAVDSCVPFNVEFTKLLYNNPQGVTRKKLESELNLPSTNVHRICNDLLQLGIIRYGHSLKEGRGRPSDVYKLNEVVHTLWSNAFGDSENKTKKVVKRVRSRVKTVVRRKRAKSSDS